MEIEDTTNENVKVNEKPPYADDPAYKTAMKTQDRVSKMLEKHGFESVEELNQIVEEGSSLMAIMGGKDATKLVKDAKKLQEYEEAWKLEDENKLRDGESSDDTIARMEKENKELKQKHADERAQREADKQIKKHMKGFNDTIKSVVKASDLPKAYHKHALAYMGVDNPAIEVDIAKPAKVKQVAKDSIKNLEAFAQTVIEQYKKGKQGIPNVPPKEGAQTTTNDQAPKGFKGARQAIQEQLGRWR